MRLVRGLWEAETLRMGRRKKGEEKEDWMQYMHFNGGVMNWQQIKY
jgi:hypothetical protein